MSADGLAAMAVAFDLTDGDIEADAERIAEQVQRMRKRWAGLGTTEPAVMKGLRSLAARHHVDLPTQAGFSQRLNRMSDPAWWRRALRKRLRTVEHQAIQRGGVHRHASPYVSAKGLRRFDADRRRLAGLLAELEVMNVNTGEVIPLDDVIAGSQANPANRRKALMVRIKGIEARARDRGDEALFLTITAPSRMHARHHTGQANAEHDGSSPRQVQAYLHGVWRKAMRSLQRNSLSVCGVRVVEPHHDGCPHWHVLLFAAPGQAEDILQTLRTHALADSPDEPGAAEHRFKFERIDPAKGSAVGYVAKYVSKSIDGDGLDGDIESDTTGTDTARRVVAWARRWGIRQFQFFGLPPITPTRELHSQAMKGQHFDSPAMTAAHAAVWANDYAAYLGACDAHGLAFALRYEVRTSTRYADELARAIRGLRASAADLPQPLELTTRTETWCIQPRKTQRTDGGLCLSRTRFNNCAPPLKSGTCTPLERADLTAPQGQDGERWRPAPASSQPAPAAPPRTRQTTEETPC